MPNTNGVLKSEKNSLMVSLIRNNLIIKSRPSAFPNINIHSSKYHFLLSWRRNDLSPACQSQDNERPSHWVALETPEPISYE
ncbi:hypothetical protein JTE90_007731 [Oedothorax gibbosus]|uniref:Uncharacterized protein n=1 Tax=Oedothorax gibbosus TaxID=931172 RepID=A0AAV6V5A7_9ARAC|nr:hypothetical protein JTE90_007731 [Oedothorax gibbosus]